MKKELTLEQQANMLLYGYPDVIEPGDQKEVWTVLGGGAKPKREIVMYTPVKPKCGGYLAEPCITCGQPRQAGGAGQCRSCYRNGAQEKFRERSPFIEFFLERQLNVAFADGGDLTYYVEEQEASEQC